MVAAGVARPLPNEPETYSVGLFCTFRGPRSPSSASGWSRRRSSNTPPAERTRDLLGGFVLHLLGPRSPNSASGWSPQAIIKLSAAPNEPETRPCGFVLHLLGPRCPSSAFGQIAPWLRRSGGRRSASAYYEA